MEAQTDVTIYLEQGKQALAEGQGRDAAIAYAHAAQLEPENPLVHLGLAEANLALNAAGVVQMACRRVQELAPSGPFYELAQALLDLLDRRYEPALQQVDAALKENPGDAYAHALRAHLLRATGQSYDAGLARSRASRLSFGGKFENCFPEAEPLYASGYSGKSASFASPATPVSSPVSEGPAPQRREQIADWQRPNAMQRRAVRTRFWLSQKPRFLTYLIIAINVVIYLVLAVLSGSITNISTNALLTLGGQVNLLVSQGQFWRIFTAMFLHFSIFHIAINMLSLFFVGSLVEIFYGKWRYLVIYLVSGIIGGLATYFLLGTGDLTLSAGASGAIFGAFGALGAFFIANRRAIGPAANGMIGQWLFWLVINFAFDFTSSGIGIQDHIGGLIAGIVLGVVLLPPMRRVGRRI